MAQIARWKYNGENLYESEVAREHHPTVSRVGLNTSQGVPIIWVDRIASRSATASMTVEEAEAMIKLLNAAIADARAWESKVDKSK